MKRNLTVFTKLQVLNGMSVGTYTYTVYYTGGAESPQFYAVKKLMRLLPNIKYIKILKMFKN
jgi:hypothetical protein